MKIKRIIIACLVSVFGIINVNAASLEITGVSTLKTDENGKYEIKLKDVGSDEFTQVEFEVAYDSSLIKFEGNESSDYSTTPNYSGNKAFIVSANNYKDGVIGAFNITNLSGENATTSFVIKNIKFKKGDVEVGTAADYSKTLTLRQGVTTTTSRPKNTSASVTSLSFKNATMKPAFNQSIHEYKLYTKDTIRQVTLFYTTLETGVTLKSECTVGCTVSSQSDTIIQTIQGKNEVIFKFTSEDEKNTEEYKFIIYRGETTDGSNKLAGLNIKDYNINEQFDENTLDYTASVPYEVENLEINATSADENAKVEIKGNNNLKVGENVITITVTPTDEENEIKIYNITVIREEYVSEEPTSEFVPGAIDKKDNSNIILIILIVLVSLTIIGVAAYLIFFNKKKNKKDKLDKNIDQVDDKTDELEELPKVKETSIIDSTFEEKEPTSVEDALDDLMKTKGIFDDNNNESL
ncbi:MAG: cadherin-like beta sandwich domain-containing protein [Tenericutes bacterium]|nr:cadherin-like beta sandwich domain-containing protein [Mycoplasmatota bacterium]